jgi:hypothetical protein
LEKERTKGRGLKPRAKKAKPKVSHKGAKERIMFQITHQMQISERKGNGKPERAISLEKPSPANKSSSFHSKYSLQQTHLKLFIARI